MRVVIAPDHFGGALTAGQAASVLAGPWRDAGHEPVLVPMSDGRHGLIEAVLATLGGELTAHQVPGALGQQLPAPVLTVAGEGTATAYIEAGAVLGHGGQIDDDAPADPLRFATDGSSAGVADLLWGAVDSGAGRIVVGLGPSPTHDAGAGMLTRLAELAGVDPAPAEEPWRALAGLRRALAGVDLVVAAARDTALIGLDGAGAGLQRRGVSALDAQRIERNIADSAHRAHAHANSLDPIRLMLAGTAQAPGPSRPHTGAGGGVAFALGLLGARLLPGALVVAEQIGLRSVLSDADLVLTGTAIMDADAMHAGVVATVGETASNHALPVVALAREVYVNRRELAGIGISAAYPLVDRPLVPGGPDDRSRPGDPVTALAARGHRVMRNWSRT